MVVKYVTKKVQRHRKVVDSLLKTLLSFQTKKRWEFVRGLLGKTHIKKWAWLVVGPLRGGGALRKTNFIL